MAYTVKYLSDTEFDLLPYEHVKTSLGCADMRTKIAYVRRTKIPIVDQFTTDHEIEELIAKHSDHEVNGIRYKNLFGGKGGGNWLSNALQVGGSWLGGPIGGLIRAAGVGQGLYKGIKENGARGSTVGRGVAGLLSSLPIPYLQPIATLANLGMTGYDMSKRRAGMLDMVGAGAPFISQGPANLSKMFSGFGKGVEASSKAGGGMLGKTLSGLQGAFGGVPKAVGQQNYLGGLFNDPNQSGMYETTKGVAPYGQYGNPTNIGGANPGVASNVPSAANINAGNYVPALAGFLGSGFGFGGGSNNSLQGVNQSSSAPQQIQSQGVTTQNIGTVGANKTADSVTKTGLWDKIFGTGNMGKTMLGASVPLVGGAFAPKVQQFDPMKSQLFTDVLSRVKQGNMLQLTPEQRTAITARYDQELDTAKNNIMSRWRATRPGSDITNDTELQKAISDVETQYAKEKANAIVGTEIGLTQQQTSMLSELASLDIYSMAQAAQVSVEEAKAFKEMLGNMGFMIAGSEGNMFAGIRNMFQG